MGATAGIVVATFALAGCGNSTTPNALRPAGDEASTTATVWWVLLVTATVVGIAVIVAIVWGSFRTPRSVPTGERDDVVIGLGGAVLPALVLIGVAVLTVWATAVTRGAAADTGALQVDIVGRKWFWDVRYPDAGVVTANEIRIPVDRPVELTLRTADVIHSFWVPELAGKQDMIPGQTNRLELRATRTGTYIGACAEFCGVQHAGMGITVVVLEQDDFDAWLADRRDPSRPTDPLAVRGRQVFDAAPCGGCHRIAGTDADGDLGPDLTDLAERRTIGAGMLDNNPENLARWITDVQSVKPGAQMRDFAFTDAELDALVAYLLAPR